MSKRVSVSTEYNLVSVSVITIYSFVSTVSIQGVCQCTHQYGWQLRSGHHHGYKLVGVRAVVGFIIRVFPVVSETVNCTDAKITKAFIFAVLYASVNSLSFADHQSE